jgi:hypothetical protein
MRVKLHNGLKQPLVQEATSVVVEDELGNVIFAAQTLGNGLIQFTHMDDPEYQAILRQMGITKTVVIKDAPPQAPLSNVIWTP